MDKLDFLKQKLIKRRNNLELIKRKNNLLKLNIEDIRVQEIDYIIDLIEAIETQIERKENK